MNEPVKIQLFPITVNQCWKGRRFKTTLYKDYTALLKNMLPKKLTVPHGLLQIYLEFGFSTMASDWDNPIKPVQDILAKKYKFNDKNIMQGVVKKVIVKQGDEYIKFQITKYNGVF